MGVAGRISSGSGTRNEETAGAAEDVAANAAEAPPLPQQENEVRPQAEIPPVVPVVGRQPTTWRKYIDLGFLIRLVILAAVFSQNASKERIAAIAACMAIVYLYRVELITDLYYFTRKKVRSCFRARRTPPQQVQPVGDGRQQQVANVGFGRVAGFPPAAIDDEDEDDLPNGLRNHGRNWWIPILEFGRGGWIIWDIVSVSSGFLLSLLPGFMADELQEFQQPAV